MYITGVNTELLYNLEIQNTLKCDYNLCMDIYIDFLLGHNEW